MSNFFSYLQTFFSNKQFVLLVTTTALTVKAYILIHLIARTSKKSHAQHSLFFLVITLLGFIASDFTWIISIVRKAWLTNIPYTPYLFLLRISWALYIIGNQTFMLFIESLIEEKKSYSLLKKLLIGITAALTTVSLFIAVRYFHCPDPALRPEFEKTLRDLQIFYISFLATPLCIASVLWKARTITIPRIIKKQIRILVSGLLIPIWLFELVQTFPFNHSTTWLTNSFVALSLSAILITLTVFYCTKKVLALRFLNLSNHVQSVGRFNFIDGFKDVLDQLSYTTNESELGHISRTLFKEAFSISLNKTQLILRKSTGQTTIPMSTESHMLKRSAIIENFVTKHKTLLDNFYAQHKIFVYDEIEFSNFYEKEVAQKYILEFLELINADIFLPIYKEKSILAYIIVDREARPNKLYGKIEQDEMTVYANYLANIINLLQTRNLDTLILQQKELNEELYLKQQEISQYKESIRSFLRNTDHRKIGIIFYQSRKLVFGNAEAQELIGINPNNQPGHPLAQALKKVGHRVFSYKTPYRTFTQDNKGQQLVISGVPHLERNNVILTVYYPEVADVIRQQIDLLSDPTQQDYLLYLQTTNSGKLINELIPSNSEQLLQFKIALLKSALSKKAILLSLPEEDLIETVEIIHHVSLRKTLHILPISKKYNPQDLSITLFGINSLFDPTNKKLALLEQLNQNGTLYIQDIDRLDLETQNNLAEFIKYGSYKKCKSDQRITSDVRIIVSSKQNIPTLIKKGTFSKELYNELSQTTLTMPSLNELPIDELETLTQALTKQAIGTTEFTRLLTLSDAEKSKLKKEALGSLHCLKKRIKTILSKKSKDRTLTPAVTTDFISAAQNSDPDLVHAARLGKKALRDKKILAMLWEKYDKNQTKIAKLLGVDRSSVSRRCKMFELK